MRALKPAVGSWPARRSSPRPVGRAPTSSASRPKGSSPLPSTATPAIPTGVAFTTRSASSAASTVATTPASPASAATSSACSGRRATTSTRFAPAAPSASDDSTRRTTCSEDQATLPGRGPSQVRQRVDKAGTVGAVADQLAAHVGHGVHHSETLRQRAQPVASLRCPCLVGHRHRQAPDAEVDHGGHGSLAATRRDRERHIGPVEAELYERGIVERRRQRVPDRVADHAGDHRRGCRPRTETTTRARATASRSSSAPEAHRSALGLELLELGLVGGEARRSRRG